MNTMIKAIVTDAGGVFVSSTDKHIAAEIKRIIGSDGRRFLLHDKRLLSRYQRGIISTSEFVAARLERAGISADEMQRRLLERAFSHIYKKHSRVYADVLEYLLSFRGKYLVALFSNTIEPHARHNKMRFLSRFDRCFLSHEISHVKPTKASFRYVARQLGHKPQECIFIDDLAENVRAANSVGFRAIRYKDLADLRSRLNRMLNCPGK
jgi:glucose-1-phosphatase